MPDGTIDQTASTQEPPASTQPVDSAASQVENQPAGGSRTYTQEEVDRTVKGRIDKQNEKHRAEMEKAEKAAQEATERAEAAEKKAAEMEAEKARAALVSKAAVDAGVSADVLARMVGDTEEEIAANAAVLAEAIPKAAFPSVTDNGNQSAATVTKDDIRNIKNPKEQLRAIRENPGLFN